MATCLKKTDSINRLAVAENVSSLLADAEACSACHLLHSAWTRRTALLSAATLSSLSPRAGFKPIDDEAACRAAAAAVSRSWSMVDADDA